MVARSENREPEAVKAELLQTISMSIMKSVANAVIRRSAAVRRGDAELVPMVIELNGLDDAMEQDG